MESILFYNAIGGSGAIGAIRDGEFVTLRNYQTKDFALGWTHIVEVSLSGGNLLFYNANSGEGVLGKLYPDFFLGLKPFSAGSFGAWTHIVGNRGDGHGTLLFYNANTGAGALGFDPPQKAYAPDSFAKGWTHIIAGRASWRTLFYNSNTGAAALDFDPTVQGFDANSFSMGWTHVANSPAGGGEDYLLFYNASTRSGALGVLNDDGFVTVETHGPGAFGAWTHVVGLDDGFLFYNSQDGSAALAEIQGDHLVTTKTYSPNSFALGWTHIMSSNRAALMEEMQGYCWPLSVAPGGEIDFRASTSAEKYSVTYVRFKNGDLDQVTAADIQDSNELVEMALVDPFEIEGQLQVARESPEEGCGDWATSFTLTIPDDWNSGFYAAKCVDDNGAVHYITFVVNPAADNRSRLAIIANTTTWAAYNWWGGFSRYRVPSGGAWRFSYLRPNHSILNPSHTDIDYHYSSMHQARGELWIVNWLEEAGYEIDIYTDLDLHVGIANMNDYRAVILNTHPEYCSEQMLDHLEEYLDKGGHLLYLGGNGLYDAVEINDDFTQLTVFGSYEVAKGGRTHLFRNPPVSRPESAVLGVAFPWSPTQGDIGNNPDSQAPYRVVDASHRFFAGTGLSINDEFGDKGWCILFLKARSNLDESGASGWECDERDANSPPNVQLLATGVNPKGPSAEMTYCDHPGGGFVFSAGSMSFGGSLVVDGKLQRIIRNALDECLGGV
jgi:hypothetical protein